MADVEVDQSGQGLVSVCPEYAVCIPVMLPLGDSYRNPILGRDRDVVQSLLAQAIQSPWHQASLQVFSYHADSRH